MSTLSTAEVAARAGVHRDTLLRWLRNGVVPEPTRDRRGWRVFTPEEADHIKKVAEGTQPPGRVAPRDDHVRRLQQVDWDFHGVKTNYLTHGMHPYPAKCIPQLPNALIQELSGVGDVVADIFCGSGTTLVESLILRRHAIGIDANPVACLVARAKTGRLTSRQADSLDRLVELSYESANAFSHGNQPTLFPLHSPRANAKLPRDDAIDFWFEPHVAQELAEIRAWCDSLRSSPAKTVALAAFSAIIVAVSKQDSDTRYVRRKKEIAPGETFRRFGRSLSRAVAGARELSTLVDSHYRCTVHHANLLGAPEIKTIDLMVCSPPYPNAWSYHLYHMTRMIWLGMDWREFKRQEIGSHRKYSAARNGATADTFRREMQLVLEWLAKRMKSGAFACFIIGNSVIRGESICNADLVSEAGATGKFSEYMRIRRRIQLTKKSFNPSIGKIKVEDVLILRREDA